MTALTTLQALHGLLRRMGDRKAIGLRKELGLRWWTYSQLYEASLKAAAILQASGVGKGDRVLFLAGNSPEWVAFLLGAALRGAVVVPVDREPDPEFLRKIAEEVDARCILVARDQPSVKVPVPSIEMEVLFSRTSEQADPEIVAVDAEDPAIIFYTSGTTAEPRGVVLSHANLMAQVRRLHWWRIVTRLVPFRMVVVAPLSHSQGVMLGVCIPLSLGLSVIFTRLSGPAHLIRTLRDNRVTLLSTVPRALTTLTDAFLARRYGKRKRTVEELVEGTRSRFLRRHYRFNAIRQALGYRFWVVIVGGAPLPERDERFWRGTGCPLVQGYGLTETAAVVSITSPFFGGFGSVGRPLSHQDVRIADDGEILVRGPNVTSGYLRNDIEEAPFTDGYLRTGDLGYLDGKNRLHVSGRKKSVIVTGEGFNVASGEVEVVLNALPGVRDSVVYGANRDDHLYVHAVLLLTPSADPSSLVQQANNRLQPHQRIQAWHRWPEPDFPRSAAQKVKRKDVQRAVEEWRSNPALTPNAGPKPVTLESIREARDPGDQIKQIARYVLETPAQELADQPVSIVRDLGLSSLSVVELLSTLERESEGLMLENVVVREETTIADLGSLVRNNLDAAPGSHFGEIKQPPRWAELSLVESLRGLFKPWLLGAWVRARARVRVEGVEELAALESPFVLAGIGHEHAFDAFLIYCALPRRLRRKISLVTSRWVFTYYLDPDQDVPWWNRFLVSLGFNLLAPLFFPIALTPRFGTTREGMLNACRHVDRGFSPIVFEGGGTHVLATQCGVPIVPVFLSGNQGIDFIPRGRRPDVVVRFGTPMPATPDVSDDALGDALSRMFLDSTE